MTSLLAGAGLLVALAPLAVAQTPGAPAQQLQALLAAQQAALRTDDPAQVLAASKPVAALALRLAATLDLENDQLAVAHDLLTRSAAIGPQPATALLLLTADVRARHPGAVAADVAAFLQLTGDTAAAHLPLAQTFQAAGDLQGTIAQLQAALALDPRLPSAHLVLGAAYWQLNEFQYNPDSLREFTLAQEADPSGFLPNLDLASLLSQYHRFSEAAKFFALAAAADPASPDPSFQLGMNLYSEADGSPGSYAAARAALEQAVQLTGTDLAHNSFQIRRAFSALSRIAALEGRAADAEKLGAEAEQLHAQLLASGAAPTLSESSGLLVGAGGSHANAPELQHNPGARAVESRQEESGGAAVPAAASAQPASGQTSSLGQQLLRVAASALNDAGTALARTQDYASALPLFRQAAEIDPTLSPVLRNLGLAAFHAGALAEAAQALGRALQLDPNDALARRYLDQIPHP